MKKWLAVGIAVAGMTSSGMAQQNNHFKVTPSHTEKAPKKSSAPIMVKSANPGSANAKDLQALEHQTAKSSMSRTTSANHAPKTAPLKQAKERSNPPINLGGGGGASGSMSRSSSNPYKGRLKQKYSRQ